MSVCLSQKILFFSYSSDGTIVCNVKILFRNTKYIKTKILSFSLLLILKLLSSNFYSLFTS